MPPGGPGLIVSSNLTALEIPPFSLNTRTRKKTPARLLSMAVLVLLLGTTIKARERYLPSPNGEIELAISTGSEARLSYRVFHHKTVVVEPSTLDISVDGMDLGLGVIIRPPSQKKVQELRGDMYPKQNRKHPHRAGSTPEEAAALSRVSGHRRTATG